MKKLYFTLLIIWSLSNFALSQTATLSGHLYTPANEGITQATVILIDQSTNTVLDSTTTNNEGLYQFPGLPINSTYRVEPSRDGDDLNGVSTFDMVLVRQHIVATNEFSNPLNIIAADVNNSQTVTTLDMVLTRNLIIANTEEFQNASSWRFVRSTIEFSNSQNPFEGITNNDFTIVLTEDVSDFDFIGIKTGDVNGSVVP